MTHSIIFRKLVIFIILAAFLIIFRPVLEPLLAMESASSFAYPYPPVSSLPNPGGAHQSYIGSPPAASIEVSGQSQTAAIGSSTWIQSEEGGKVVRLYTPAAGVMTPLDPLNVTSNAENVAIVHLILPVPDAPDELALAVYAVISSNELNQDNPGLARAWQPLVTEHKLLPLQSQQDLPITLKPGLNILEVYARWDYLGDVLYGFLLQVEPSGKKATAPPSTNTGEPAN